MDPNLDPFAAPDEPRTFIKPNPGGRAAPAPAPGWNPAAPAPGPAMAEAAPAEPLPSAGLNPLVALANPLLMTVTSLRGTRTLADPGALRQLLAQGIRDFATQAAAAGIAPDRVMAARYVLCTMLDEAAADTPWGGSGTWARHSLLATFHNETWGGEKVFQLMARLAENPGANRDLLELIHAALTLGFEGRYRVADNGRAQLEAVRDKLTQLLQRERGPVPPTLAEHWAGHPAASRRGLGWLPLAAAAALVLLLLGGTYAGLAAWLGARSDPVFGEIQSLRLAPPVAPVAQPAPRPRLAQFLQADIKAGLVAVRDEVDRSVVTLRGDGLFEGGSAALAPEREALMARIGDALAQVGGPVLVTGHTDNQPIRTARFPSNWHLSEARARTVRELLVARQVPAERIRAEGRADGEPLVPNDSPGNRSLNRRVEVTLLVSRPDTAAPAPAAAPTPAGSR